MQNVSMVRQQQVQNREVFISCIVPAYNEAMGIGEFLLGLTKTLTPLTKNYEIIIIDDGSYDETVQRVTELAMKKVKLIVFSRNFGKENAIAAGLKRCIGDVALIIDADFQHPFAYITKFIQKWMQGYDMVYAVRKSRMDQKPWKRFFSHLFYRLVNILSNVKIPPHAGDFRLMDRKVVQSLNQCGERARFMKGLYAWVGHKSIGIPYQVAKRRRGGSSWQWRKLTELAITGFTSFSDIPLRLWGVLGSVISLIAFIYAAVIVIDTLAFGIDVPGYATIVVAVVFFGGIQLLSIGILGEYIARIFHEVKKRPPYIIDHTIGFDDELTDLTELLYEEKIGEYK